MSIQFGTDGWRAVISDTFTFDNLHTVMQAVADTIASEDWVKSNEKSRPDPHLMVVGYDTRFLSDCYAEHSARVLAANGFTVHLSQVDAPTPAVALAVKNLNATAGVMITASHNAPRYNGVKLKAAPGNSALPEQCRWVEDHLKSNLDQGREPHLVDFDSARLQNLIREFNPLPAYLDHLRSLLNPEVISGNPQEFIVDSMHGSGHGVIMTLLEGTGCQITEIRADHNPGFEGLPPEPIARYLDPLSQAIKAKPGNFGLVTDGDADRIGAMDESGHFVDPHKIMALSLRYLVETRGLTGAVVRTISTTRMIDRLVKRYGLKLYETPVGFNHIAEHMLQEDILIGGEESGGISFKGHIPQGDGPLMGSLLVEMIAAAGQTLQDLVRDLLAEVGPAFYERTDLHLRRSVVRSEITEDLLKKAPAEIGGQKVSQINDLDGVKYILADDSWLLIRPSGTEPVLRVYAEGRSREMVKDLLDFGKKIAASIH